MKMKEYKLTKAYIRASDELKTILEISLQDIKNIENYPFLLVVQSTIENCIKLSIYPLTKKKIIRVTFSGFNYPIENFNEISKILQNFQVIHTSGVLLIERHLYYECYLNIDLTDAKAIDLNRSLEDIKNIFKEIKIDEIGLKKT
jgi:hypothetical protein